MRLPSIRIISALATLVFVLSCGGADGLAPTPSAAPGTMDSKLRAGLHASGPIATGNVSLDRVAANTSAAPSEEVSWVSLVPGTVPDGTTATIINLRSTRRSETTIVEGGFDPYPIPASAGDTIQVIVSRVGKPDAEAILASVSKSSPGIVRTRPPRGQTDAPLNTIITLVFTEPLDPASVNPTSVTLTTGGAPVAGAVRVVPGSGYTFEFAPSAWLAPRTTYTLTVNGVVNLAGTPLSVPTSVTFTTSLDSIAPPPARGKGGQAVREILVNSYFDASGLVSWPTTSGTVNDLPTTWRSRDSSIATVTPWQIGNSVRVVGIRPGTTVVEGTALGVTDTIAVTVLPPAPASAVSPVVVVDYRVLEVRYDPASNFWYYAQELVLRDTTGRGGSAIIAFTSDLPGIGPAPPFIFCRAVGPRPLDVFPEAYGDFGFMQYAADGKRASGSEAVAHITLRIPGPAAMTIDVRGPIVPGTFPTTYSGFAFADNCG